MRRSLGAASTFLILAMTILISSCEIKTESNVVTGGGSVPYGKIGLNMFPRNRTAGTLAAQMSDIRSIGVKYIRVNFWFDNHFMASAGAAADFARLDEVVEAAKAAGLEILGILGPAPTWLANEPGWIKVYTADYVTPVVNRYKGYVRHWEVWNEPDESPMFDGTADSYFELLKATSAVIRQADPGAKIVSAATVNIVSEGMAKLAWMERLVDLGLAQHADILNMHYYSDLDVELGVSAKALADKARMPVWVTETGKIGQDLQMDYFSNNMPYIDRALNPERIYWYCYVEHEAENTESHPADTYGIVAIYNGQRIESPIYSLLKSHN